jgi:UDP-N-acetylglucosamine 2-epimerase (non-hydrolysing)
VLTILGTRPEAIKLAPVILQLREKPACESLRSVVCVTGQHRQLAGEVLNFFDIRPNYDLDLMTDDQTPGQVVHRVMEGVGAILRREQPKWVIVQGDTATAAGAALASFYSGSNVAHVEAGLRTYDKRRPFPEEINRRVVTVVADMHFAPTERARANLLNEGVAASSVLVTGNTGIDALLRVSKSPITRRAREILAALGMSESPEPCGLRLALVTAHRRESFGPALERICSAVKELANRYRRTLRIVCPVHPNPEVGEAVRRELGGISNVLLTEPLDYATLVHILRLSHLALTDSGGIQEEAPSLGVPVLVMREATERPEGVESGNARIIGTDTETIVEETSRILDDLEHYRRMALVANPYGDGKAAERIVAALVDGASEQFSAEQASDVTAGHKLRRSSQSR